MSVTKRTRFEVFKRDLFTCQYCGRKPPEVTLEVDHIEAVANGGTDDADNLITSCFDCNRGKSDIPLELIPQSLEERQRRRIEALQQAKQLEKLRLKNESLIENQISLLEKNFLDIGYFTAKERASIRLFINRVGFDSVFECMAIAVAKVGELTNTWKFKYFCGVCWKRIKGTELD